MGFWKVLTKVIENPFESFFDGLAQAATTMAGFVSPSPQAPQAEEALPKPLPLGLKWTTTTQESIAATGAYAETSPNLSVNHVTFSPPPPQQEPQASTVWYDAGRDRVSPDSPWMQVVRRGQAALRDIASTAWRQIQRMAFAVSLSTCAACSTIGIKGHWVSVHPQSKGTPPAPLAVPAPPDAAVTFAQATPTPAPTTTPSATSTLPDALQQLKALIPLELLPNGPRQAAERFMELPTLGDTPVEVNKNLRRALQVVNDGTHVLNKAGQPEQALALQDELLALLDGSPLPLGSSQERFKQDRLYLIELVKHAGAQSRPSPKTSAPLSAAPAAGPAATPRPRPAPVATPAAPPPKPAAQPKPATTPSPAASGHDDSGSCYLIYPVPGDWGQYPFASGMRFGAGRDGGKRRHTGVDLPVPDGTPVIAVEDGVVVAVDSTGIGPNGEHKKGGKYILLYHKGCGDIPPHYSFFAHVDYIRDGVVVGQEIKQGDTLAGSSDTGSEGKYHLHFSIIWAPKGSTHPSASEAFRKSVYEDPLAVLAKSGPFPLHPLRLAAAQKPTTAHP